MHVNTLIINTFPLHSFVYASTSQDKEPKTNYFTNEQNAQETQYEDQALIVKIPSIRYLTFFPHSFSIYTPSFTIK